MTNIKAVGEEFTLGSRSFIPEVEIEGRYVERPLHDKYRWSAYAGYAISNLKLKATHVERTLRHPFKGVRKTLNDFVVPTGTLINISRDNSPKDRGTTIGHALKKEMHQWFCDNGYKIPSEDAEDGTVDSFNYSEDELRRAYTN